MMLLLLWGWTPRGLNVSQLLDFPSKKLELRVISATSSNDVGISLRENNRLPCSKSFAQLFRSASGTFRIFMDSSSSWAVSFFSTGHITRPLVPYLSLPCALRVPKKSRSSLWAARVPPWDSARKFLRNVVSDRCEENRRCIVLQRLQHSFLHRAAHVVPKLDLEAHLVVRGRSWKQVVSGESCQFPEQCPICVHPSSFSPAATSVGPES